MLKATATLVRGGTHRDDVHVSHALLESFVIHYRALLDFFYPGENLRPDDMVAHDYFDDPAEWDRIRPKLPTLLKEMRPRANKEIAHLSYGRLDVAAEAKGWKIPAIAHEVEQIFVVFIRAVPKTRLDDFWVKHTTSS